MPRKRGVWGTEWDWCDRCGFIHPITELVIQNGYKRCRCHGCLDDVSDQDRAKVIAESLANSKEGQSEKGEVYRDPGDVVF